MACCLHGRGTVRRTECRSRVHRPAAGECQLRSIGITRLFAHLLGKPFLKVAPWDNPAPANPEGRECGYVAQIVHAALSQPESFSSFRHCVYQRFCHLSFTSNKDSTGTPRALASLPADLGAHVPRARMVLMLCRESPLLAASAAWVNPRSASMASMRVLLMFNPFTSDSIRNYNTASN